MNGQQAQGQIRTLLAAVFGILGGYAVHAKWVTPEEVSSFLTSQIGVAVLGVLATMIWSALDKTKAAIIARASALPEVKGIITEPTPEGVALATTAPDNVVPAGSPQAATVAKAA